MYIINSKKSNKTNTTQDQLNISQSYLKYIVENIAIPRHYFAERQNNFKVAQWIKTEFLSLGLEVYSQGKYNNIIATYKNNQAPYSIIVGAHYDSVPDSFGADDNASAVAGMLAVAKALQEYPDISILFIAFNREEDGLLGSQNFVDSLTKQQIKKTKCVHILEMIGYCSDQPKSQLVPPNLPVKVDDIGNFIAIIANKYSNKKLNAIIKIGENKVANLPIKGLKVFLGLEKFFPHLLRSDHAPFWKCKMPALMWTDTSEFRNPNYHQTTDTPDTLDYAFMEKVVKLLAYSILEQVD